MSGYSTKRTRQSRSAMSLQSGRPDGLPAMLETYLRQPLLTQSESRIKTLF